jgi:hypothetical protein
MKSFDKFNVEAMVHHIALKEGMSYDERQSLMEALPLAIPAVSLIGKGLATAYGMWSAYNAAKKLMPQQTQQRPAVDYGQGGGSFASSTEKPKAKVTTTGGVPAQPAGKETTIDPKAKPVKAPEVPKPKPRSTDWGSDPSTRPWGASGSSSAKPEPVKPEQPKRKPTPIRDIAAVGTGAAIGKATPPIGKKPAPQLGDGKDEKPKPEEPAPQLGADDDKKPKPKPKPRVKTQAEIDREQGRNDAEALPPVRPRGAKEPTRINVPPGTLRRSRTQ